jgi:hypothetical protein
MLAKSRSSLPTRDELGWISEFLSMGKQLSGDDIRSVLYFALLWNLFEGLVCHKNAYILRIERAIDDLKRRNKLNIADYDKFLTYFSSRYTENGRVNYRFGRLNLRETDTSKLVELVLRGDEKSPEEVLLAMLIIVYSYRNNLFHGEKSIYELPEQIENFGYANQLLMLFMENWKSKR